MRIVMLMDYVRAPRAKYTVVGEAIRYIIPAPMQCSMGCGGPACKYDSPSYWSEDKQAIKGLYSSWVTDYLLAMSRPSTEVIEKYNIIDQFKRSGIKTVINLQRAGEHANCGKPLEPESGFSYRPEVFMENDIFFYNFVWDDYGVANLTTVLDIVKVMAFATQEGKIAVHCHAGLGRTGVLMACFLAYATRMSADQAILYVRAKRPNSIQTRGQLQCVRQFVQFLAPLRSIFSCSNPPLNPVTLSQYLVRQRHILHGYERRELRHLPKIIQLICRLLVDIVENRQVIEEDILEAPDIHDIENTLNTIEKLGPELVLQQRLPGPPSLPRHFNEPAIFYHRKSLSYSDSDLRRLGSELNLLAQPLTSLSQSNVHSAIAYSSTGSLWEQKNITTQKDGSLLLKKTRLKEMHRRGSLVYYKGPANQGNILSRWKAEQRAELTMNANRPGNEGGEDSEVPFITLQTELSLGSRRLLVAQALAVDLFLDGEEEQKHTVLEWEAELNQGGAWERLCMERDPFILTGLMWAWLEQLKEPAISIQAAKGLNPNDCEAQTVLNSLDQAPKETLTCILECMAHLLLISEEVEAAFLNRAIKAFTWLDDTSEEGRNVYENMTVVLRRALQEMRSKAIEEEETCTASLPVI